MSIPCRKCGFPSFASGVREDRTRDAISILQAALHAPLDGSGMYVTRTEVHEALGDAFHMAGEADSAVVHYQAVVRAWAHGDPPFAARAARAQHARWSVERARGARGAVGDAH